MTEPSCVFCDIVGGRAPAQVVGETGLTLGIVPLNPVTEGHVIFIPKAHVDDALADPLRTADTMRDAAVYARAERLQHVNLITSVGMLATQTIRHLHIHVVPRCPHDGLALPWSTDNNSESREYQHNAYLFYSGVTGGQ